MYKLNVYTRQTDTGWEGFAVEQHSGHVIHKAETETQLLIKMHTHLADAIANCLCVKSLFDFSEKQKHEYPINYRLNDKVDINQFKHTPMRITANDIQLHRRKDNQWLRDSYGQDLVNHDKTCEACKPRLAA